MKKKFDDEKEKRKKNPELAKADDSQDGQNDGQKKSKLDYNAPFPSAFKMWN